VIVKTQPSMTQTNGTRELMILSSDILATAQAANRLTPNGGVIVASDVPDFPVQGL
jgi:hypothetical protein